MFSRLLSALALLLVAALVHAQDYPSRAISITVPNPPGGMNQIHAKLRSPVRERVTEESAPTRYRPLG